MNRICRGPDSPVRTLSGVGVAFYVVVALSPRRFASLGSGRPSCWIWWRSAPSPIWFLWIATTACWWRRD